MPQPIYSLCGIISGIAFYLLVNTPAEGSANNRQYQLLALILAAIYAFAALGDYSPVALLSTGPIIVGCLAAMLKPVENQKIRLKSGKRFWGIAILAAISGMGIAAIWQPIFPNHQIILWSFGGIGLLAEALAQVGYTANWLSPRQFRFGQTFASSLLLSSFIAQSNGGSVAFNSATLLAMLLFAITDKKQDPSPP